MDLLVAFDTVDHEVHLQILNNKFGVSDSALNWFKTYLQPRQFKVKVKEAYNSERNLSYIVPLGSCAGANNFNLYCSPLGDVMPPDLNLSGFTNYHSIRSHFNVNSRVDELECTEKNEKAMVTNKKWMDSMWLKMNTAKTEFIYFGHRLQLRKCTENRITIAGDPGAYTDCIKYLGATIDSELAFKKHVVVKCKAAMCNLLKSRSIRHLLDETTTVNLCLSLCISYLDYANGLPYGLTKTTLNRMQDIQNICVRLILRKTCRDSITECRKKLH